MTLTIEAKPRLFFDRREVIEAVGRGNATAMARVGGFVRTTASRSIRRRKRASRPGETPTNRTGFLKESIRFQYEPRRRSVVIGPIRGSSPDIPQALEYGGVTRSKRRTRRGRKPQRIKARPFMNPAFAKARADGRLADAFENMIKG